MAGLVGYNPHHAANQYVLNSNNIISKNTISQNMTGSVNSTMQVTQINFPSNDANQVAGGGIILPIANQSSHEFKMKHNSSNQSFHSQKKITGGPHVAMTTIRKPGALAAPSLDNSFNNHLR